MDINFDNVIENEYEREHYIKLHKSIKEFIEQNNQTTFQEIVKTLGGSDRRILRLLNEMRNCNELILKNGKISSEKKLGKKIQFKDTLCSSCGSKIIPLTGIFEKIKKEMEKIYSKKPVPTFVYDQRPVNSETTVRRAAYLLWRNDLIDKEIVVIGDDDLTSLSIGLIGLAKKITVLDIDERVINFIKKISDEKNLNIEARVCDFTKEIPEDLVGKFDVFLTDPTPIPECFSIFISLGIKLLKKEEDKVGYVSFFPSHQKISLDFQDIINKNELIITDMIPRFTEYDFLEQTYSQKDKELLKEFDYGENKISFFENHTRFVTTYKTFRTRETRFPKKVPLSKAMKRVMKDPSKDPSFMEGNEDFVNKEIGRLKNEL